MSLSLFVALRSASCSRGPAVLILQGCFPAEHSPAYMHVQGCSSPDAGFALILTETKEVSAWLFLQPAGI